MKHILIVEHVEHLQNLLDYAITPFEDVDVDWSFVATKQEALDAVPSIEPQVLIVDADLPDGSAPALCDTLRERSGVKIILLQPMNQPLQGLGCAPDATVTKPFDPTELQLVLGKLLGIRVEP